MMRLQENPGVWEHRGKVAVTGIGHSPTSRRWDGDPEHSVGAWTLLAIKKALDDAGVAPEDVDGLVISDSTTTGAFWPADKPLPEDFVARHGAGGANSLPTDAGGGKYGPFSLVGTPVYPTAMQFQRYLHKYGVTH